MHRLLSPDSHNQMPEAPSHWPACKAPERSTFSLVALALAVAAIAASGSATAQSLAGPQSIHSAWKNTELRRVELPAAITPSELPREANQTLLADAHREAAKNVLSGAGTVALLLMDRGQVVFEGYAQGATEQDRFLSFSIAKTMTALAVGEALCAGHVRSLDDRADTYARDLAGTAYGEASIRDLLRMASGARGGQASTNGQPRPNATSDVIRGLTTVSRMLREHGQRDGSLFGPVRSGSRFAYSNPDTDALSRVVQGATGEPFATWFSKTVLARARPEATSFWGIDSEGSVIAHAMYLATLRDWARLAGSVLDLLKRRSGNTCMQDFVQAATSRQILTYHREGFTAYGYQIWLEDRMLPPGSFWMMGFGGQRIGIDPVSERIVVTFAWQPQSDVFSMFSRWARDTAR